jgi:hypothetical protein
MHLIKIFETTRIQIEILTINLFEFYLPDILIICPEFHGKVSFCHNLAYCVYLRYYSNGFIAKNVLSK